jgi:hypothetical protein
VAISVSSLASWTFCFKASAFAERLVSIISGPPYYGSAADTSRSLMMRTCSPLFASLLVLAHLAAAQSPGPDWPMCALTSFSHNPGWEVLHLRYDKHERDSALSVTLQSAADGSQTTCAFSKTSAQARNANDLRYLDNSNGECTTSWVDWPNEEKSKKVDKPAKVSWDGTTGTLKVEQSWECRSTNGQM